MGRGDRRSRKGKIWRGTFGKSRPKTVEPAYVENKENKETKEEKKPAKKSKK